MTSSIKLGTLHLPKCVPLHKTGVRRRELLLLCDELVVVVAAVLEVHHLIGETAFRVHLEVALGEEIPFGLWFLPPCCSYSVRRG